MKIKHKPVLVNEITEVIKKYFGSDTSRLNIVDCTLGDGGHSHAILDKLAPKVLVSLDWDISSITFVQKFYKDKIKAVLSYDPVKERIIGNNTIPKELKGWYVIHANFALIEKVITSLTSEKFDVVLWDLGLSSRQLDAKGRGFSFKYKSPLDLRISPENNNVAGYTLLNILTTRELTRLFVKNVGMPTSMALNLSKEIIKARGKKPFGGKDDMDRLKYIAYKIEPLRKSSKGHLHPATLILLALRMAVNYEMTNLINSLDGALKIIKKEGILLVITFHSTETGVVTDWIKKQHFSGSVITPSRQEIKNNPRSRSAKLIVIKT